MTGAVQELPGVSAWSQPPEWAPHRATWIAWPRAASTDWPGKLSAVRWAFIEMARHLVKGERVEIIVDGTAAGRRVRRHLEDAGVDLERIGIHRIATDRSWLRDSGPTFVRDARGGLAAIDWRFNAWARYPTWKKDDRVAGAIARLRAMPVLRPVLPGTNRRVVLEGGAIEVNGEGLLMATEQSLLGEVQARNPGVSREELEEVFARYLGIERTIWLGGGLAGDDTQGHVDTIARFVGPRRVAHAMAAPDSSDHAPLEENRLRLEEARDVRGRTLELVAIPQPAPLVFRGQRLPATYLNFYVGNRVVLVPTYNDPADREALHLLAELFPDREVVGIHAVEIVLGQGALHCLTQQEPRESQPR